MHVAAILFFRPSPSRLSPGRHTVFVFFFSRRGMVSYWLAPRTRKPVTASASLAVINTASKHLHNDLARAIKALEQKKVVTQCLCCWTNYSLRRSIPHWGVKRGADHYAVQSPLRVQSKREHVCCSNPQSNKTNKQEHRDTTPDVAQVHVTAQHPPFPETKKSADAAKNHYLIFLIIFLRVPNLRNCGG